MTSQATAGQYNAAQKSAQDGGNLNAIFCSSLAKTYTGRKTRRQKNSENGTLTNCPFLWKRFIFTPEFPFNKTSQVCY